MGTLGLIGGGLMGTALIKGLLKQGYPATAIYVADPDPSADSSRRARVETLRRPKMLVALSQRKLTG